MGLETRVAEILYVWEEGPNGIGHFSNRFRGWDGIEGELARVAKGSGVEYAEMAGNHGEELVGEALHLERYGRVAMRRLGRGGFERRGFTKPEASRVLWRSEGRSEFEHVGTAEISEGVHSLRQSHPTSTHGHGYEDDPFPLSRVNPGGGRVPQDGRSVDVIGMLLRRSSGRAGACI